MDYYLTFLKKIDTSKRRQSLRNWCATYIPKISERYKGLTKGAFIDYVSRHEDFYMITTYRIEDMNPIALYIVRQKNGQAYQQYYAKCYVSYFSSETEWRRYKFNGFYKRYCYTRNLKQLFKDTSFKYSYVWKLGENIDIKIRHLLAYCDEGHIQNIERLIKLKCYRLARNVMNGQIHLKDDNNILKACGFENYKSFKKVIELDMDREDLRAYEHFSKIGLDYKYFKLFKGYLKERWGFPSFKGFSEKSFVEYYLSQRESKLYKGSFKTFVIDYQDYLRSGIVLKYDFSDTKYFKPYNFKLAHDQAYLKAQSQKNKTLDAGVKKVLKNYQCLNYNGKIYSVVVPKTADEIRLEGKNMCHCVGGYVDRVKNGNSLICFVRHTKEKDKCFYTLELNPKTLDIVQCRGYKNNPTPEENKVQNFVKAWRKNIVLKLLKVG